MKRTIAIAIAALLVSTVLLPAASADAGEELVGQEEETFAECVLYHRVVVTECIENYDASLPGEDLLECLGEHLKNGWFVGNCL
jgi:hypothetical protein